MNRYPTVWGGGQLLAFSGIDGVTDYENGLSVTVNYNDTAVNIGGVQIAPHDWSVTEKGG